MVASKAITLVLIGSTTALLGYQAIKPPQDPDDDFSDEWTDGATTRPSNYYPGNNGYYTHHSHSWFWTSPSHFSSSSGYSHSTMHGTSRGGFGHVGHASGS